MSVTANLACMIEYLEKTERHMLGLPLAAAKAEVEASLTSGDPKNWKGPFRAEEHVAHAAPVPAPNVRGMATMFAEAVEAINCFCGSMMLRMIVLKTSIQ